MGAEGCFAFSLWFTQNICASVFFFFSHMLKVPYGEVTLYFNLQMK